MDIRLMGPWVNGILPLLQRGVASSILAGPTIVVLIWWFAAISPSGDISFFEYVKYLSCESLQQRCAQVGMKVTTCQWKDPS